MQTKKVVKTVVAAAIGDDKKPPLKMELKNIKCRAYREAEKKATSEGLSMEDIIAARTKTYAETSFPK